MNSMQLKDKLRKISKEKNVDINTLLRIYMYDRFIERLSISKCSRNFVIKGGFYLSTLFGIDNRSTMLTVKISLNSLLARKKCTISQEERLWKTKLKSRFPK